MRTVAEVTCTAGEALRAEVYQSTTPIVLRDYVSHWPAVGACASAKSAAQYLAQYWCERPLTVYVGGTDIRGRFSYNEDCTDFNFRSGTSTLREVLFKLEEPNREDGIDCIYVGSTPLDGWLPGFQEQHMVELPVPDVLANFWLGNRSTISAHFDFPDNLACVVAGQRRFTLFPPEQIENLYVGPVDRTPSGQAISLVDFESPDFDRFPAFREALNQALVAELGPGDALFIPGMWWHHVRSLGAFNMLINYWWRTSPEWLGAPYAALIHALLALKDLPERQREAWKNLFNHYVFDADEQKFAHIPKAGRGILDPLDEPSARRMRADLINRLKG